MKYLLLLFTLFAINIHANEALLEIQCKKWAKEDGIEASELAAYIEECKKDQAESDSDSDEEIDR